MNRRIACGIAAALAIAGGSARAQDIVYTETRNGITTRYEQYGYGKNAYIRLTQVGARPLQGSYDPAPRGVVRFDGRHERYGPGPEFGTISGLIGPSGDGPAALYNKLGPGTKGQGNTRADAYIGGNTAPVRLNETRYSYPDPNQPQPQPQPAPQPQPQPAPQPPPPPQPRPRVPPPPPQPINPRPEPAPGAVPPPPAPGIPPA
ncbi:MAG: hypothetical protein U0800_17635 [Isosphaeraceae bacterium]